MTVTDNGDGTYLVTTTAEEQAMFTRAVNSGLIPGGTADRALHGFLAQAFQTMTSTVRQALLKELESKLRSQDATTLQTILGNLA